MSSGLQTFSGVCIPTAAWLSHIYPTENTVTIQQMYKMSLNLYFQNFGLVKLFRPLKWSSFSVSECVGPLSLSLGMRFQELIHLLVEIEAKKIEYFSCVVNWIQWKILITNHPIKKRNAYSLNNYFYLIYLLISTRELPGQCLISAIVGLQVLTEPGGILTVWMSRTPPPVFPALHDTPGVSDQQEDSHTEVCSLHQDLSQDQS